MISSPMVLMTRPLLAIVTRANSATHAFGALLAIVGTVYLLRVALAKDSAAMIWSGATYGTSLVALFLASTIYHLIPLGKLPRFKNTLQAVDHAAIFLLIAGTYTPFALVAMRGAAGWTMFGLIWSLAVVGICLRLWAGTRYRRVRVAIYLFMGWTALLFVVPFVRAISSEALVLVAGGGLAYTGGVAFYVWRSLPYHHVIWHVFVLVASGLFYAAVMLTVSHGSALAQLP